MVQRDHRGGRVTPALCVAPRHAKPRQALDGLLLCRGHYTGLEAALTDILDLYALLPYQMAVLASKEPGGEKHVKQAHPPAPINLAAAALTDRRNSAAIEPGDIPDVPGSLAGWVDNVAEERHLTGTRPATVYGATRYLELHLAWIAAQPWVDEFDADMRVIRQALSAATKQPKVMPVGRCPVLTDDGECGTPLYNNPHSDAIRCRTCRNEWSGHELIRLRLLQEAS
jgi:hypothetical protein